MHKDIERLKKHFLSKSSFTKFFYKDDILIYLDQDFSNGDITIILSHKGGSQYAGKLRFSQSGKLRESYLLTSKDLTDLMVAMEKLWGQKKYEQIAIPRDEFLKVF